MVVGGWVGGEGTRLRPIWGLLPLISGVFISQPSQAGPPGSRRRRQKPERTNIETLISAPGERGISGTRLPSPQTLFCFSVGGRLGVPDLFPDQLLVKRRVRSSHTCTKGRSHGSKAHC